MDRCISLRSFLLVLALFVGMGLVGCSGDDDDDDSSTTPTPSPTPEPFDDTFRIIKMEVGTSSEGVDIDGDGDIDNAIEDTLNGIVDSTVSSVTTQLQDAGVQDPTLTMVETILTEALSGIFTVDALTNALNVPIENFQTNYMLEFQQQVDGSVSLTWYNAEMQPGGSFEVDTSRTDAVLGEQTGTLDLSTKTGEFAGDIGLTFVFETPSLPAPGAVPAEEIELVLVLAGAKSTVEQYNDVSLRDMMFGGAIIIDDIVRLIESVLNMVAANLPEGVPFDVDAIVDEIATQMEGYSDVTVNGQQGFSIGVNVSADASLLVVK